ncbi:MAG: glycosyltransferase family A protein [bacterium]|nr:glycosyltransferase family A protein [bacterium]
MPKISIITPLYNGTKTFEETADSVLSQDFENWEWILYDDGSRDGIQELGKKFAEKYKGKVFYFEHENNKNFGTAYTRNRAAEKATGNIISFIDQDDIWYKNRLSHQLEIFRQHQDCAMIWGPALYWYSNRTFVQPVKYNGEDIRTGVYESPRFIEIFLRDLKGTPLPGASLVRKESFIKVKGYDESIRGSEDIVLWLKIAEQFKIYFDDKVLIKYRKHQDSTLGRANQSGEMYEWNLIFYKWVIEFLKKNKASERLIEENEFAYYITAKKIVSKEKYADGRKKLLSKLNSYPELKKKFMKDYFLDLIMPMSIASKVSAKLRFDLLRKK